MLIWRLISHKQAQFCNTLHQLFQKIFRAFAAEMPCLFFSYASNYSNATKSSLKFPFDETPSFMSGHAPQPGPRKKTSLWKWPAIWPANKIKLDHAALEHPLHLWKIIWLVRLQAKHRKLGKSQRKSRKTAEKLRAFWETSSVGLLRGETSAIYALASVANY